MNDTHMNVFISHAPEDAEIARRLYSDLKTVTGIEPWMADADLLPGQNRKREINRAIRKSRFFIPVLSSRSVEKSGYMHKEMRLALDELDEMPDGEVFVIPVRADDCEPAHDQLLDIVGVDLFPSYEAGLEMIKRTLAVAAGSEAEPEKAKIVSPSFSETVQKGPLPANLRTEKIKSLSDALMGCSAMKDARTRALIVNNLPTEISRRIDFNGPVGTAVPEIVERCMDYPGAVELLIKELGYFEGKSIPFAEVWRIYHLDGQWELSEETQSAFQDHGDGTVTDRATGLMWQKTCSSLDLTYLEAIMVISNLIRNRFAGYSDWRLPEAVELKALTAKIEKNSAHCFEPKDISHQKFWESDELSKLSSWELSNYFKNGGPGFVPEGRRFIRAVRP